MNHLVVNSESISKLKDFFFLDQRAGCSYCSASSRCPLPEKEDSWCDQFILEFHKPFEMRRSIFNIYQTYNSQSNSDVLGMKLGVRYYIENKLSRCILHICTIWSNTHDHVMYDITKKRLVVTNLNTTLSEKKPVDIQVGKKRFGWSHKVSSTVQTDHNK